MKLKVSLLVVPSTVRTGLMVMVKVRGAEVPPPGAGVATVIGSVVAVVRSLAGIVAVNCVALTNVVVSAVPLKSAVEPLTKLVPVSVMVVSACP